MNIDPNLRGRIPVEPLDDDRLTRIERNVVMAATSLPAVAPRVRMRGLSFAIATCAVAAAALISWRVRGAISHDVAVAVGDAPAFSIATHAEHQTVDVGDASIDVTAETAFAVTRPDGGVLIELAHGRVELEVAKRHGRPPLVVRANETDVIVVGTHFSVDAGDGHGDVDVRVIEGVVRVVRHGVEARVAAGQEWHATNGIVAAIAGATVDAPVVASADGSGANASATAAGSGSAAGPSTIATADVKVPVGTAPTVLHGRTAAVPVVSTTTGHAGNSTNTPTHAVGAAQHASAPTQATGETITVKIIDIGTQDPAVAIQAFQKAASATIRAKASEALYSAAFTQMNCASCGGRAQALRTLDLYLQRFQSAPERADALALRMKLLCGKTITAECRQAAASYLRENPNGDNAGLALRITQSE